MSDIVFSFDAELGISFDVELGMLNSNSLPLEFQNLIMVNSGGDSGILPVFNNIEEALEYSRYRGKATVGELISYYYMESGKQNLRLVQIINQEGDLLPIINDTDYKFNELSEQSIDSIIFSVFGN